MKLPELWLSPPAVRLPTVKRTNADVLGLVRAAFVGTDEEWEPVNRRIRSLLRACGSDVRYFEPDCFPLAGKAAAVAQDLLTRDGVTPESIDLLIYASLAREYFEPATSAEVAGRLGANRALALDVTAACAGSLLAIQDVVARAAVDDSIQTGVVCTATMTPPGYVQYGIQTTEEVAMLGAGLTLGNASTAMIVSRNRPPTGGRIVGLLAEGMSEHHELCRAPVRGHFVSDGPAIFALGRHIPGHVRRLCARVGWQTSDVDLFVSHQPSNSVLRAIAGELECDGERLPWLHALYGNCAESSVPLVLRHLIDAGKVRPGMRIAMVAAASGFVMASLALEWE